ncbi:MAG: metal-dependent hydrolase [Chloroflexi bacterium]|nr:metal-dependent hydrolase [Chloroflexota bacterium]
MNTINHVGLTLLAAVPVEYIIRQRIASGKRKRHSKALALAGLPVLSVNGISALTYFDFRLVIIGSIVPDILDKPMGFLLAPDLLNNNLRTIGHGGLFALAFVLAGLAAHYIMRNPQLLVMAIASAGHMVLDQMWQQWDTVFWPFLGLEFRQGTTTLSEYIRFHVQGLLHPAPLDFVTAGIILGFMIYVIVSSGIGLFIKSGRVLPVRPV